VSFCHPNGSSTAQTAITMSKDSRITYHLQELEIARNPKSPFHAMPSFSENDTAILDIGCGIGQTLVASSLENGKLLVGIDIDLDSLIYGQRQFGYINFVNGTAEWLPFQSESFDFVISRVTLPKTNIPKSLNEIRRVLKKGGKVWFTLHPFSMSLRNFKKSMLALLTLKSKSVFFHTYVMVNGIYFHIFGKQFAYPVYGKLYGKYESFQTESGIIRALENAGFRNPTIQKGNIIFAVTAQNGA
jgi:ubiquinone/menaquinone biosynthesis C-methylase UbiE